MAALLAAALMALAGAAAQPATSTAPTTQPTGTGQATTQATTTQATSKPTTTQGATSQQATTTPAMPSALLDPATGQPDLQKVLDHLDDLFRSNSSVATMRLVITKPRRTRTLEMKAWTRGRDKALIVIQQPRRDAGTATLKVGDNLWNYLPRISRTIRIPPSMMLSSWMGSDLTNDDIVRESSLLDDFHSKLLGRSAAPPGWLIELRAKEGTVGLWQKIDYVLSPDATLPVQARYHDRRGRLARTMDFLDVKVFRGRRIPSHMVLTPADEKDRKTEMFYLDIDFGADVPDSTFSLSRLERSR